MRLGGWRARPGDRVVRRPRASEFEPQRIESGERRRVVFPPAASALLALSGGFAALITVGTALLVLPGLVLVAANAVWVGLLLGMVCARFRDVPQIVTSLLRPVFFLTPIIWKPELLGKRMGFVDMNPFFHFIELVRAPLLGQVPAPLTWTVVLAITAGGWLVTFLFFRRFRSRIPYWV